MIKSVLKDDAKEKYKFDVALRYVKNKLSIFRTEERRRVSSKGLYMLTYRICVYMYMHPLPVANLLDIPVSIASLYNVCGIFHQNINVMCLVSH